MSRNVRLSRLNLVYLARRHAGVFALVLAVGIAGGLAYQAVLTPRAYESGYQRSFFVVPPLAAPTLDWNGRLHDWSALLSQRDQRILLTANLRAAVKKAVLSYAPPASPDWSPERLFAALQTFRTPQFISTYPRQGGHHAYVGPDVEVGRADLARNLDFHALARVVCNIEPRSDVSGWDFSAQGEHIEDLAGSDRLIINPSRDDPYFGVFYRLYALVNDGREAADPADAWQSAVDEVAARIAREMEFQGGGGFDERARAELLLEIDMLPLLAANSLYRAAAALYGYDDDTRAEAAIWEERWLRDTRIRLDHDGAARGRLIIAMQSLLHPFSFPVDSPQTRITPLAVRTLFAYIAAWDSERNRAVDPAPEPVVEVPPEPEPVVEVVETPDPDAVAREEALRALREKRARLEAELHQARLHRDDAARRLEAARLAAATVAGDADAARARADRLKERLDEAELVFADIAEPEPDPELVCLWEEREALLRHIAYLLQSCTDEHPFVVQARRELAALESRLALLEPPPRLEEQNKFQTRLLNLRAEWSAESAKAASLDERRKRRLDDAERILAEFGDAERMVADLEFALTSEPEADAAEPGRTVREINHNIEKIADRVATIAVSRQTESQRSAAPGPAIVAPTLPAMPAATISFSSLPGVIPLMRVAPSALPLYVGAGLGLLAGLLLVLVREFLTFRVPDAYTAVRLVDYPLLAALPAYDTRTMVEAAKAEEGKILTGHGRRVFVPDTIEQREPPPLGKRKPIRMRRKGRRVAAWIAACLALALGLGIHFAVTHGWFTPVGPFAPEIWWRNPPAAATPAVEETP